MPRPVFQFIGGFIAGPVIVWSALVGWNSWMNAHLIVDGPENESPLFRSYDPEQVIKQFRHEDQGGASGRSSGASRSIRSIQHDEDFTPVFAMHVDQERQLLQALREDILIRLRITGMTVTAITNDVNGGFTYRYTSENSVGRISVQAPMHQPVMRPFPLPSGLDYIGLKIALDETWTRPTGATPWWMSAVD